MWKTIEEGNLDQAMRQGKRHRDSGAPSSANYIWLKFCLLIPRPKSTLVSACICFQLGTAASRSTAAAAVCLRSRSSAVASRHGPNLPLPPVPPLSYLQLPKQKLNC